MLPPGTIACSRCGKHLPSVATFCDGCGNRIAQHVGAGVAPVAVAAPLATARPGFVAAGRGMSICHGCGAIAPTRRSTCEVCDAPIGTSLEAIPARDDGAYWVQLRSELVCRQCGQRSPLDPLAPLPGGDEPPSRPPGDGSVTCGKCGSVQAFDPSAWEDALAHAHAVGDLGGPDLTGKNGAIAPASNPFAELGTTRAAAEHVSSGMTIQAGVMKTRNIALAAAPGHPLCAKCGCPLHADARGNEVLTRCVSCGEQGQHRFPVEVLSMSKGLVAAIGDELRIDRPAAKLDATSAGAVIAIKCPSCGASLAPQGSAHFVTCTYCQTHCRIPQRTLLALRQGSSKPDPWWALFRGPSPMRAEILGGGRAPAPPIDDDEDDDDRPRRRRRRGKKLETIEQPPVSRSPRDEMIAWALQIAIPVVLVAAVGVVLHGPLLLKWISGATSQEAVAPNAPR